MFAYIAKRVLLSLLVAFTVSAISFSLLYLSGDAATALAGEGATPEVVALIRDRYGLNDPVPTQYARWLSRAITGDFGDSIYIGSAVGPVIFDRLPVTLTLGTCALSFALILAIPLGVLAAMYPNTLVDKAALLVALFGQAMPNFWFALLLMMYFGLRLRILPISGNETWRHFVLPSISLGYFALPAFMRLVRGEMLEILDSDFIRTARAKGLSETLVVLKHGLRNALIPVVSLAAVQLGFMLGGSIIIEQVFAINGIGALAWESILRSDFPVVQALVLLISAFYLVLTLLADVLNAAIDPRIRQSASI